jgi:hypothetical protein
MNFIGYRQNIHLKLLLINLYFRDVPHNSRDSLKGSTVSFYSSKASMSPVWDSTDLPVHFKVLYQAPWLQNKLHDAATTVKGSRTSLNDPRMSLRGTATTVKGSRTSLSGPRMGLHGSWTAL